jgi:hypothetical protein
LPVVDDRVFAVTATWDCQLRVRAPRGYTGKSTRRNCVHDSRGFDPRLPAKINMLPLRGRIEPRKVCGSIALLLQ